MKIIVTQSNNVFGPVGDETTPELLGYANEPYSNIFFPTLTPLKSEQVAVHVDPIDPARSIYKNVLINPWTIWDDNTKLESIRLQRNYLLKQTDWTALNDVPLSPEEKTAYENYRQQLRDFPDVVDLDLPIEEIIWPTKP